MARRTEIQHNTRAQVETYLTHALDIVTHLEIDDDLRPLAFSKAVDLIAAKNVTVEQASLAPFGGIGLPRSQ